MANKQSAVDLAKFVDKGVHVKLAGGREVSGVLKGYDQLLNMVLDEAIEYLRGKATCTWSPLLDAIDTFSHFTRSRRHVAGDL